MKYIVVVVGLLSVAQFVSAGVRRHDVPDQEYLDMAEQFPAVGLLPL